MATKKELQSELKKYKMEHTLLPDNNCLMLQAGLCKLSIANHTTSLEIIEQLQSRVKELEDELVEVHKALNMEETPSQFHPKIPYKWKYKQEVKRTKRQSEFIQQLQAELEELKGKSNV